MDRNELRLAALKLAQDLMANGVRPKPEEVVQAAAVYANWLEDRSTGPVDFRGNPVTLEQMDEAMGASHREQMSRRTLAPRGTDADRGG